MNDLILSNNGSLDLIALNHMQKMVNNLSEMPLGAFNRRLDHGPGGAQRDVNKECGYPETGNIGIGDYRELFDRECVAARVVEVVPKETWQVQPNIYEDEDSENNSPFEQAWDDLGKALRGISWYQDEEGNPVWEYLLRADIRSGIGAYGVLLLGLLDGKPLSVPVEGFEGDSGATAEQFFSTMGTDAQYQGVSFAQPNKGAVQVTEQQLKFMRCYDQSLVQITRYESNRNNPRFGQPTMYRITLNDPKDQQSGVGLPLASLDVHWSRVIHIADNPGNNDIFGIPRMRPVYNRLLNLRKLYGGSAEMYWQGAFPGLSFETHPSLGGDVSIDQSAIQANIQNYINTLQRYIATEGMTVKPLAPQVVAPNEHIDVELNAIALMLGIPLRILLGSERGELASNQDDKTWNGRLMHRQQNYVTPKIIVPFVDRLIQLGVLPEPEGYSVHWPDLNTLSPTEQADLAVKRVQAYGGYISGGCDVIIPPADFLTRDIGLDDEEAEESLDAVAEHLAAAVPDAEGEIVPGREPNTPPLPGEPGSDEHLDMLQTAAKAGKAPKAAPTENYDPDQPRDDHGRWEHFAVQRASDGKYHAPTSNNAWGWHKSISRAYRYEKTRMDHVMRYIQGLHRDNWRYSKIPENESYSVVGIDKHGDPVTNFNPNHDKYGKFAAAAREASYHARKSDKAKDHAKAANAHTLAAVYGEEDYHATKAAFHSRKAGKAPSPTFGKIKDVTGQAVDKFGSSVIDALAFRVANEDVLNRDVSSEPRDFHGRWTNMGSVGEAFKSFTAKVKTASGKAVEGTKTFGSKAAKHYVGKDKVKQMEQEQRQSKRAKKDRSAHIRQSEKAYKTAKSMGAPSSVLAKHRADIDQMRADLDRKEAQRTKRGERKQAAVREEQLDKVYGHFGNIVSKAAVRHIDKTAEDLVKQSMKEAKAKEDTSIYVWGTEGKKQNPVTGKKFNSQASLDSWKNTNKGVVHRIERGSPESTAPTHKLSHRVRENLKNFAKEGIRATSEEIGPIGRELAKEAIKQAVVAVIKAATTNDRRVVLNGIHPRMVKLIEPLVPALIQIVDGKLSVK